MAMTKTEQITNSTALMTAMYRFVSDANAGTISTKFMEGGVLKTYTFPNAKKIQAPIVGHMNQKFDVNNTDFMDKLLDAPNGGYLELTLTSDVRWDRNVVAKNRTVFINLNGHKLYIDENYNPITNTAELHRFHAENSTITISGGGNTNSKMILPNKTQGNESTLGESAFVFGGATHGSSNTLHLAIGLTVVDNGDFSLISSLAGGTLSVISTSLDSPSNRHWRDLIHNIQITNGVAKNFSTNVVL